MSDLACGWGLATVSNGKQLWPTPSREKLAKGWLSSAGDGRGTRPGMGEGGWSGASRVSRGRLLGLIPEKHLSPECPINR